MAQDMDLQIKIDALTGDAQKAFESLGSALSNIQKELGGTDKQVDKSVSRIDKLGKAFTDASKKIDDFGKSLTSIGTTLTTRVTAPLLAVGALAVREFGNAEEEAFRLSNQLRLVGRYSQETMNRFRRLGDEMQKFTRYSSGAVQSAAGLATQFAKSDEEAEKLTRVAADLATVMGIDLESAIRQLGSTFSGQAGLLSRQFIGLSQFSAAQLRAGAAVDYFASRLQGSARAASQTFYGQLEQLKNSLNDVLGLIGENLAPFMDRLIKGLNSAADAFKSMNDETRRSLIIWGGFAAVIGPMLIGLGSLIRVVGFAAKGIGTLVSALKPLLAVFSVKGALITGVVAIGFSVAGLINMFLDLKKAGVSTADTFLLVGRLIAGVFADYIIGPILRALSIVTRFSGSIASIVNKDLSQGLKGAAESMRQSADSMGDIFDQAKTDIDNKLSSIGESAASSFTFGFSDKVSSFMSIFEDTGEEIGKKLNNGIVQGATEGTQSLWDWFLTQGEMVGRTISSNLSNAFLDFADGTKSAKEAMADFAKSTLRWIAQIIIQQRIMQALQSMSPGFFGSAQAEGGLAGTGPIKKFARGGPVRGPGTSTSDSIPALLSDGEFVINARTVRKFGAGFFYGLQSLAGKGPVQKFNTGGLASTSGGGMQVVIENTGSPKEATGSEVDPQTGVTTIFLEDLQRNGPIAKGIQGTFNVKRGGFR